MEIEIKLSPVSPQAASQVFADELLTPYLGNAERYDMESIYYTDAGGVLRAHGAALRMRHENGRGVVCLKINNGEQGSAKVRHEFEAEAATLSDGIYVLCQLPEIPNDICEALQLSEITPECGCSFTRTEALYSSPELAFALSFDIGECYKGDLRAPLSEIELELKGGSVEHLNTICKLLMERHGLIVCEVSKYRRALMLGDGSVL